MNGWRYYRPGGGHRPDRETLSLHKIKDIKIQGQQPVVVLIFKM
jgi:hypothetical protein